MRFSYQTINISQIFKMKSIKILSFIAIAALSGCSKKNNVQPATSHSVNFTTNASGYNTVISLQKNGTSEQDATVLTSVTNTGTSYTYQTTITTGDHLLISISPNNPKAVYHYQIDDNAKEADAGDINVAAGTSLVLHYPKSN